MLNFQIGTCLLFELGRYTCTCRLCLHNSHNLLVTNSSLPPLPPSSLSPPPPSPLTGLYAVLQVAGRAEVPRGTRSRRREGQVVPLPSLQLAAQVSQEAGEPPQEQTSRGGYGFTGTCTYCIIIYLRTCILLLHWCVCCLVIIQM